MSLEVSEIQDLRATNKVDITTLAQNILQNGEINQEEARILGEYLHAKGNITQEGRKNWYQLSTEIRKDIQEKIGVKQDGDIGPKTIQALNNLAEKQEIEQSLSDIAQATYEIGSSAVDVKQKVDNVLSKDTIEIINPAPDYIAVSIGHRNDSTPSNNGKDTGDSFSFSGLIVSPEWKTQLNYNGFTAGEKIRYDDEGIKRIDTSEATRLDTAQINVQKSFYSKYYTDGSYINIYSGVGIQKVGDLGGDEIQNAWHELGGWYQHEGKYEDISKITGTLNASIEGKKYFDIDSNFKPFIEGNLDFQKSLDTDYGTDKISGKIQAGVDYDDFTIGAYIQQHKRSGVEMSDTINLSYKNEKTVYNGLFAEYRNGDYSYQLAYGKNEIYLGGKINF